MRAPRETPCRECPLRRDAMIGWTGAATPEELHRAFEAGPMPCHMTVDYDREDWRERGLLMARQCAGQAIYLSNTGARPRVPTVVAPADHELIFSSPHEFVAHHRSQGEGSWAYGPDRVWPIAGGGVGEET